MRKKTLKIITFLLTFTILSNVVNAEGLPGARSATNENGDVFLGGNYIEVGISKGGSFGTSSAAPESFKSHATQHTNYQLGLISDGDGWDVGNAPTTGDFFLPGTPEERYGISYKIGDKTYQYFVADRMTGEETIESLTESKEDIAEYIQMIQEYLSTMEETDPEYEEYQEYYELYQEEYNNILAKIEKLEKGEDLSIFKVRDESDKAKGLLKAVVSGTTPEKIKVEIVYSFGTDDKYYNTEVYIKNQGNSEITDVRFLRSFDPDQDADLNNEYETYNKVISNPLSTEIGSDKNYAMVVARGVKTFDGFFFVSFDNRSRVSRGVAFSPSNMYKEGFWVEKVEGQKNFSTDEDIEITEGNLNGYLKEDNAIAIMFNLGTLKTNENTELSYYSSLDPNVIESMNKILKAVQARLKSVTDTEIIIDVQEGYEYSVDGGETWNETGIFKGLEPGKTYTVISRIKGTTETETSEYSTKKSSPSTPEVKINIVSEDNIKVQSAEGYEYSIDGGKTWQDEPNFDNLEPDTEYTIIARYKETDDTMYGTTTTPITIKTPKKIETELDTTPNAKISLEVDDDAATIIVNKGLIYEMIKNDETIKHVLENNDNINIKFIVKNKKLNEENINEIKEKLEEKEKIAFSIDASIELYVNGMYEKNIAESENKITFTIEIPEEYQKTGRKFYVLRKHINTSNETRIEKIEDEDDDATTITVSSDKFSDFTIVYEDEQTTANNIDSGTTNPNTSDTIKTSFIILTISTIGILGTRTYIKKQYN